MAAPTNPPAFAPQPPVRVYTYKLARLCTRRSRQHVGHTASNVYVTTIADTLAFAIKVSDDKIARRPNDVVPLQTAYATPVTDADSTGERADGGFNRRSDRCRCMIGRKEVLTAAPTQLPYLSITALDPASAFLYKVTTRGGATKGRFGQQYLHLRQGAVYLIRLHTAEPLLQPPTVQGVRTVVKVKGKLVKKRLRSSIVQQLPQFDDNLPGLDDDIGDANEKMEQDGDDDDSENDEEEEEEKEEEEEEEAGEDSSEEDDDDSSSDDQKEHEDDDANAVEVEQDGMRDAATGAAIMLVEREEKGETMWKPKSSLPAPASHLPASIAVVPSCPELPPLPSLPLAHVVLRFHSPLPQELPDTDGLGPSTLTLEEADAYFSDALISADGHGAADPFTLDSWSSPLMSYATMNASLDLSLGSQAAAFHSTPSSPEPVLLSSPSSTSSSVSSFPSSPPSSLYSSQSSFGEEPSTPSRHFPYLVLPVPFPSSRATEDEEHCQPSKRQRLCRVSEVHPYFHAYPYFQPYPDPYGSPPPHAPAHSPRHPRRRPLPLSPPLFHAAVDRGLPLLPSAPPFTRCFPSFNFH